MLFRIEAAGKKPSFLKGTLHSADPRIANVQPPAVFDAILACETAVFEMDLSNSFMDVLLFLARGRLPAGASLRDQIGEGLFDKILEKTAQEGIDRSLFDRLKPWACFGVLSVNLFSGFNPLLYKAMAFFAGGEFLDKVIHKFALEHGKKCAALENINEVISLFESIPLEDICALLNDLVSETGGDDDIKLFLEKTTDAYLSGNLDGIMAANDWYNSLYTSEAYKKYWRLISDERSLKWLDKIVSFVDQGGAFIAVGIAHLAGPQGLVALLRERGYSVQQVV